MTTPVRPFRLALATLAFAGWAGGYAPAAAAATPSPSDASSTTVIGASALLSDGASALEAGRAEEGLRLTLAGLTEPLSTRELAAGHANACAALAMLNQWEDALNHCNQSIQLDSSNWRAYNNRAGVTAEFNVNALRHLNRELGTDFDLDAFEHTAVWVENQSRIEMHLVSKREQDVHLGDETVHIQKGEHLTTEFCHKYTLESFADLAATAGLSVSRVWLDPAKQFSVQLLEPRVLSG